MKDEEIQALTPLSLLGRGAGGEALLLLAALSGCAGVQRRAVDPTTPSAWRYTVAVAPSLSELTVTFCAPSGFDGRLEITSQEGVGALRNAVRVADGTPLVAHDTFLDVHTRDGDDCVRWSVDLDELPRSRRWQRVGVPGRTVMASSSRWLWRPTRWEVGARATVHFELPPGVEASVPWPGGPTDYTLDSGAFWWEGSLLLGALGMQPVQTPGAVFNVARTDATRGPSRETVTQWLTESARATSMLLGRFPAERVQITLVAQRAGGDPVAFGLTRRGGGAAITLIVDPDATAEALTRDWVAVHESVHLAHPVLMDEDAWLGEGLATYYQEVLRARAGLTPERAAWMELCAGMDRGRAGARGRSLREDSATMHHGGGYTRVYWGGVAVMLLTDVAMRRRVDHTASLDTLVRALDRAWHTEALRTWTADEAGVVWNRAAGFDLWGTVIAPALDGAGFPEVEPTLRALGVQWNGTAVTFDDDAPDAELRRAIMAPPPTVTGTD